MSAGYSLYALLMIAATMVAFIRRDNRGVAIASAAVACTGFLSLYLLATEQIAQDREGYFAWYKAASQLVDAPDGRDGLFTEALSWLPHHLEKESFYVVFAGAFYLLLSWLLFRLVKRQVMSYRQLPFVLLIVLCDRLFIDGALNTTRGSLALVLVLHGLVTTRPLAQWAMAGIALGVHAPLAAIALAMILVLKSPWISNRHLAMVHWVGLACFTVRVLTGEPLFGDGMALLNVLEPLQESERVLRGLTTVSTLTSSLAIQMAAAVILPWWLASRAWAASSPVTGPRDMAEPLWRLGLAASSFGFILCPDFQLAQRLFLIALIVFPMFIKLSWLKGLGLLKLVLILAALSNGFSD